MLSMSGCGALRETEYTRTPSPGRSDCRKHSPWTADRQKKKRKEKSPDCKLPDVAEDATEPSPPKKGAGRVFVKSRQCALGCATWALL